jgi:D-alanine-D-alanine ligase
MTATRVLILYNQPVLATDHPDAASEHEILYTIEAVHTALTEARFTVARLGVSHDPLTLIQGVKKFKPDVVFNLFEGTGDDGSNEAYAAGLLQWMNVPFTGCPAETLHLARNKPLTKRILRSAGLPTADCVVLEDGDISDCALEWPVIVKPGKQDASVGLDQGSVVTDREQLEQRVLHLLDRFGPPVLVEEFIPGRELNVSLVELPELTVLPISEILFVGPNPGLWPIVTYDAKWRPESEDYIATPPKYPADVSPRLTKRLNHIAKEAFRLTGCRDYARVDFRVKPSGRPYVLEVNPNPDFSPDAGFSGTFQAMGLGHSGVAVQMVRNALARKRQFPVVTTASEPVFEIPRNGLMPVANL